MKQDPKVNINYAWSIMEGISRYHREYEKQPPMNIHVDTKFALTACCCVLAVLFLKPI